MNSKERQVMQQALEALERADKDDFWREQHAAITALKSALENEFNPDWDQVEALQESLREHMAEIQRLRAAMPEPVQEPVAWNWMQGASPCSPAYFGPPPDKDIVQVAEAHGKTVRMLYTTPPQRKSVRTGSLNEADFEGEMIADAIKEHFGVEE